MNTDNLKPKHGETASFNIDNPRVKELLIRIIDTNNDAVLHLGLMFAQSASITRHMQIPCLQCLKDTALQYREVSDLINELIELK